MRTAFSLLAVCSLAVAGCSAGDDDWPDDDSYGDDDLLDDDAVDGDGPCAGGGWGLIGEPEGAIHVAAGGSDVTGDGSEGSPVGSLERAVELARAAGPGARVGVWPGDYGTALVLEGDAGGGASDDGLSIAGCAAEEVVLAAGEPDRPVLTLAGVTGVTLSGLALEGGRRGIWARDGAEATLSASTVTAADRVGVLVDGPDTLVTLDGVSVFDPVAEDVGGRSVGVGIAVVSGRLVMTGGGIYRSTLAGLFVEGDGVTAGTLALSGVRIETTLPSSLGGADLFGRGVHLQDAARADIAGSEILDSQDAGLFSLMTSALDVEGVVVSVVRASAVSDADPTPTGDGIVVTGRDPSGKLLDPAGFSATLTDCAVSDFDRAGIVLERVTASLNANSALDAAGAPSIWAQDEAVATPPEAAATPAEPYPFNRERLDASWFTTD